MSVEHPFPVRAGGTWPYLEKKKTNTLSSKKGINLDYKTRFTQANADVLEHLIRDIDRDQKQKKIKNPSSKQLERMLRCPRL